MALLIHHEFTEDQLHIGCYTVADSAARATLEATFVDADRGMLVLQLDDGTVWQCVAAATLAFIGQNLSAEGYSVDGSGTVTIKLGDAGGTQKITVVDVNDVEIASIDSDGRVEAHGFNIVCFDNEVVCFDNEVVTVF